MFLVLMAPMRIMATNHDDDDAAGEDNGAKDRVDYDDEACLALLYSPSSEQLWRPGRKQCRPHQPCRQQRSDDSLDDIDDVICARK